MWLDKSSGFVGKEAVGAVFSGTGERPLLCLGGSIDWRRR